MKDKDFVNVDKSKRVKPDIRADVTDLPWKWAKNDSAELIKMDNLIEHIPRVGDLFIKVIRECHRVLKKGGILWLRVPELRGDNLMAAFSDPTHVNYFTAETTDYFDRHHKRWKNYGQFYGIPPFDRMEHRRKGRFLIIRLRVVK